MFTKIITRIGAKCLDYKIFQLTGENWRNVNDLFGDEEILRCNYRCPPKATLVIIWGIYVTFGNYHKESIRIHRGRSGSSSFPISLLLLN